MKWCSVTIAAVMFADFIVVWAPAVLAAVTVWNDVVELPAAAAMAAVALRSLASVAVAACFAVEPAHGSAVELVHAAE